MSLSKGAVKSFLQKEKLNAPSSAEVEMIGINDELPMILWFRYLIEAKRYGY